MREILFRGKRKDNSEWVEGYYCKYGFTGKEKHYIIPIYASALYAIEVLPETVGQYTGICDKNSKKIFEEDIVKTNGAVYGCRWAEYNYEFEFNNKNENFGIAYAQDVEVIGNIHDNPDLLEGGTE